MSEKTETIPETGATAEQIESAALRMHGIRTQSKKVPHGGWPCAMCHGQADAWAPHFVPPGTVIADASRVLTDAEIEAVRWVRSRLIAAKAEADMCGMDGGNLEGFRAICTRVFLDIFRPIDEYDAAMTHLARLAGETS